MEKLTIEEAISQEREVAEIHRNDIVPKEDYHNMPWIDKENELNMRSAEEHEQFAEWLEELKAIKSNGRYVQGNKAGQKIGYKDGYNKAIDEFSERLKQKNKVFDISNRMIDELAEQLKSGRSDE